MISMDTCRGDKVLVTVATKLKKIVSGYGDVYRFGGDEFVVVIDSASTQVYLKDTVWVFQEMVKFLRNI